MKSTALLLILSISFSVTAQTALTKVEWMLGSWTRTNAKPGRSGVEIWKKNSNTEFVGSGISLRGTDTTFVEKLKLIVRKNKIYYVADVPENKEPVLFEMTSQSGTSVTFENPNHDFPKKISYELNGTKLKATISDDSKAIEYLFEK